ncbi:hypothetical protein E1297_00260, partial [Roseibium sp. RKSG952]|nr:hypothetical protein [Roseibium sp. RKSG952]
IDQWYASSKTCSNCDEKHEKMTLDVRNWTCSSCCAEHVKDSKVSCSTALAWARR